MEILLEVNVTLDEMKKIAARRPEGPWYGEDCVIEFSNMCDKYFDKLMAVVEAAKMLCAPSNFTADTARLYQMERDANYLRTALKALEQE